MNWLKVVRLAANERGTNENADVRRGAEAMLLGKIDEVMGDEVSTCVGSVCG
jgi:hypothetical protein